MMMAGADAVGVGTVNFLDPPRTATHRARVARVVRGTRRHTRERTDGELGMTGPVTAKGSARDHLALALDVGDLDAALAVAEQVQPWFGIAKVGFELYAEAGPDAFSALQDRGFRVFADLKLHDIPNTVNRAAACSGVLGVDCLNFHAAGGEEMVRAGVEGLAEGARDAGSRAPPVSLAVTVLTSEPNVGAMDERLRVAAAAGCTGVVSRGQRRRTRRRVHAAHDGAGNPSCRQRARRPGARRYAAATRSVRGADWLVIGRPVTRADDPAAAAAAVAAEVDEALANGSRGPMLAHGSRRAPRNGPAGCPASCPAGRPAYTDRRCRPGGRLVCRFPLLSRPNNARPRWRKRQRRAVSGRRSRRS